MFGNNICFKQKFFVCIVALLSLKIRAHSLSFTENLDFIFKICNDTLEFSDSRRLYIWNWNQNFRMFPLIRLLHENLISTILIDHHNLLKESVNQNRVKNILIVLNDCKDIRILIRNFADDKYTQNTTILHHEINLPSPEKQKDNSTASISGYRPMNYRNDFHYCHYCLKNDKSILNTTNSSKSVKRVRSLFISRIFNGENNLIFYVYKKEADNASSILLNVENRLAKSRPETFLPEKSSACDVQSIFKFLWEIFRGFGVLICPGERICYSYNPFSENIVQHTDGKSASLGNSRFSMNNQSLSVLYILPGFKENDFPLEIHVQQEAFQILLIDYFAKYVNCSLNYTYLFTEKPMSDGAELRSALVHKGLNANVDLIAFDAGVRVSEPWHYDFSPALDTSSVVFVAPRRGYLPQSLVVFKSFTPSVWMMILFAFVFSIYAHHLFKIFALKSVRFVFTESELMSYERFSPTWSAYCYLIGVTHQRLLLGRLLGGKLLFITMVFSTLILATLLQSEMITLISSRVRYSDINTIEDLERSDLQIQSSDLEKDRGIFGADLNHRSIHKRLTDNYVHLSKLIGEIDDFVYRSFNHSLDPIIAMHENSKPMAELTDKIWELQLQMIQTDAFLCSYPIQVRQDLRDMMLKLRSYHLGDIDEAAEEHELHFLHESVMSFPFSFAFPKYSVFAHMFSDLILRLADNGHIVHIFDKIFNDIEPPTRLIVGSFIPKVQLRPFSVADLGSAFTIITCGLLLSCLVFIVELFLRSV